MQRGDTAPTMSVKVRIPAPLRAATDGAAEVTVEPASVAAALGELEGRFPNMKGRLRDDAGELRRFVNLYVNGEDVRFLAGLETGLKTGDELSIIPAVAGGSSASPARPGGWCARSGARRRTAYPPNTPAPR